MNDKTREIGRTREEWGPDERGARRTTNTSDRSDIRGAWIRAYVCKAHENPEIWGDWEWEAQVCCVYLLTSSGKDPEIIHVCTTFGLGLVKTERYEQNP